MEAEDAINSVERWWGQQIALHPPGACLGVDALIEMAEQRRRCPDYEARMDHISACPPCRSVLKELLDLAVLRRQLPAATRREPEAQPPWRTAPLRAWAAACMATAAAVVLALWSVPGPEQTAEVDWPGRPVDLRTLQVVSLLPNHFLVEGDVVHEAGVTLGVRARYLAQEPASIRGDRDGSEFIRLVKPDSTERRGLLATPSEFEWTADSPARRYQATLEAVGEDGGQEVRQLALEPVPGVNDRMRLRESLEPGRDYRLSIWPAGIEGMRSLTQYRLRMLTKTERRDYEWALQHKDQASITSALIFWNLRRYQEAVDALPPARDDPKLNDLRETLGASLRRARQPDEWQP